MAREVGIKVKIDGSGGKAGIKEIENETKRAAAGMRGALSGALSAGMKGGQDAAKKLIGDVRSAVGVVGGLLGGLGLAELVKGAVEANSKFSAMAAGIKFAGGSAKEAAAAQAQAQKSALAWGQDSMKVVDAFQAIRGETGSIEFAQASIDTVSEAARGAHKSLEGMSSVAGTLNEKFGITAEQLPDALADVVGLSEKGGLQFEDMAERLGVIGALAKEAGLSGREGFGQMLALMNVADNSTGNLKKGITAVGGLLEQLGTTAGKQKIGASLGLSQKDLGGNAAQQIEAIMRATKGQKSVLEKAFGGEQLKVLVDLGRTYSAAFDSTAGDVKTKSAAGAEALRASLADAGRSTVSWADLQKSAAASMAEAPQKIATATEKLRQAFQSDKMQSAMGKIIDRLPAMAELFAKIAGWTVDNPGAAISAAIVASIGKAAIGEAVGSVLGNVLKSFPAASVGVGLLATAAIAAADAVMAYEAKKDEEAGRLQSASSLANRARSQLAKTGEVDKDTIDELARRRADLEAVRGAAAGGGVEKLSFTQLLAAKITGGADQIAAAEAITEEAQRLGPEGVEKQIAELDALLAAAAPVRARPVPFGPPEAVSAVAQVAALPMLERPGAAAPAAPAPAAQGAPPGIDPATWAQLQGAATANALGAKEIRVRVTNPDAFGGGNAPTGTGPVTPGSRPR